MRKRQHQAALWLCIDNSSSAESDTPRVLHSRSSIKCQEPGIALRVRHLRTCQSLAPKNLAAATMAGQRSEENTSIAKHRENLSPLSRPSIPLREIAALRCLDMAKTQGKTAYRAALSLRMKAARERSGYTQKKLGDLLGIGKETYKKQENRGAISSDLVELFCALTLTEVHFLMTGEAEAPQKLPAQRKSPSIRKTG